MKFSVLQLQVSKQSPEQVIAAKRELMFSGSNGFSAWMSDHFTYVMDVDASDLEEVFHIGNVGPRSKILEKTACRASVSVGDVIFDRDLGTFHMVDDIGFTQLLSFTKEVA